MNKTGPGFFNSGSEEFNGILTADDDPHSQFMKEIQDKNSIEYIQSQKHQKPQNYQGVLSNLPNPEMNIAQLSNPFNANLRSERARVQSVEAVSRNNESIMMSHRSSLLKANPMDDYAKKIEQEIELKL